MIENAQPPKADDFSLQMERLLVEGNPMQWLGKHGWIMPKTKVLERVVPNPLQRQVGEIIGYMLEHELPVRILIYKPRQKGSSTMSMACLDWFINRFGHNGYLVGNELDNCDNLWKILRTYSDNDTYDWGHRVTVKAKSAAYGNGASAKWATAKNAESGRSATIGAMVCTEIARWAEGENGAVRDAGKVFSGLMGGVPKLANTLVIAESTVRGASGVFYEQWQAARTFEDLKAGNYEWGDFIKVFLPWYVFDDSVLKCTEQEAQSILDGSSALNDEERRRELDLLTRYKLTPGHIKYFRMRLKECDWDPEERDREEPTTEESGFYAAQPCFFNKAMLQLMRAQAELEQRHIERGILEWDDDHARNEVAWTTCPEEDRPLWMVRERPTVGLKYFIAADNSRGIAVDEAGKDPDNHAVVVIRDGYFCSNTEQWMPPKIVAALRPKYRGDIDILAEEIAKLAKWYGNCMVAPEANNDCGLIAALRKLNVSIYQRPRPATDVRDQEPTGKYGIWTSDDGQGQGMRSQFLGSLQRAIRRLYYQQEGIEIPFLHIIDELESFAINLKTGKAEALPKKHDDFVMATCFAFELRAKGSVMAVPTRERQLPRDVQRMLELEQRLRGRLTTGGGAHAI